MTENQTETATLVIELVNRSDISSIKQVVKEILRTIKDEKSSAKDLKDIIERDPPLCVRVLKLANSAYFGYPRTISDIQEAIVCIGFDAMRDLAFSQKVFQLFTDKEEREGYSRLALWQHSLAVAICSKMIYRREFREQGDDIYVSGLLHDIGIVIEDQFFPETLEITLRAATQEKRNLYEVERETLKIDHAEIGRVISINWDFPDELIQGIGYHHDIDRADKECERFVLTVYVADYICQREKIGFGDMLVKDVNRFYDCLSRLKIKKRAIEIITEDLKAELKRLEEMEWFSA